MIINDTEAIEIDTPTGKMRALLSRPAAPGRYPGVVLFTEIFQITGPIRRTAALLASNGFVVVVPEIYHEYEEAGTVLPYDDTDAARGNELNMNDNSLDRIREIQGELLMIWGRQDRMFRAKGVRLCTVPWLTLTAIPVVRV